MISTVRMPRLDDDMREGTILRWIKNEGDTVEKGEPVVEIETQKVNYEIEAPGDGILRIILAREEELVPINTVIAVIADPDDDISQYGKKAEEKEKEQAPAAGYVPQSDGVEIPPSSSGKSDRILISPVAKKIAKEKGLDISLIRGTGPGGRIIKEDVLDFKPSEKEKAPVGTGRRINSTFPFSGLRKSIADRMSKSWENSPRAENFMSVDVSELVSIREKHKETWEKEHGIRPSVNDIVIASTGRALKEFPAVNASLNNGRIEIYDDINISVAVAIDKGLITPVVRGVDGRDIFDIARETRRLAELVRKGEHSSQILADSTFTITNLGMFDIEFFVPIINPPESAILAVGKIVKKPVVINDAIAIRSIMQLCLAYDHRLLDGVTAAKFLQSIKKGLENPAELIPEGL